jgi:hypothetical protein
MTIAFQSNKGQTNLDLRKITTGGIRIHENRAMGFKPIRTS